MLLEAGHRTLLVDDFSISSSVALESVAELAGACMQGDQPTLRAATDAFTLVEGDIRDIRCLDELFASTKAFELTIEAVIPFSLAELASNN